MCFVAILCFTQTLGLRDATFQEAMRIACTRAAVNSSGYQITLRFGRAMIMYRNSGIDLCRG